MFNASRGQVLDPDFVTRFLPNLVENEVVETNPETQTKVVAKIVMIGFLFRLGDRRGEGKRTQLEFSS